MESEYKVGDIFQFSPQRENLPAQFIVATEIRSWGVQGYILLEFPDEGVLVRYNGRAFIRAKYEEIEKVGSVAWLSKDAENFDE